MKLLAGCLFVIWSLCLVKPLKADSHACGHRVKHVTTRIKRIVGGGEASQNSWPWMVNLVRNTSSRQQFCGASIIDREWLLTAAHCFLSSGPTNPFYRYTFHVADHKLLVVDPEEYQVTASKFFIHPKFRIGNDREPGDYDIALVKLSKPLNYTQYVRPVCLAEEGDVFSENNTCYATGWGNTQNPSGYHRSSHLKEVKLDFVDLDQCNSNTSYNNVVPERFLCAGFRQGGADACSGDSGGPLQCDRNGTWVQVGIAIWGRGCAEPNHYGVYTDVRTLQPFIRAIRAGPNMNLTSYFGKPIREVRANMAERLSSNLLDLLTKDNGFSDIDLVRNFQLIPYQFQLLNKTTLMDLEFVSNKTHLTANDTTLRYIAEVFVAHVKRLYIYYKSKEISKEFNVTLEEVHQPLNLTKDEFLDAEFSVIDRTEKNLYIKRYVKNIEMYRDTLLTYQAGLNVMFDVEKIEKDLANRSLLKGLDEKSQKQLLIKYNQVLFTNIISIRNVSSFFNANLTDMTVPKVFKVYLNIDFTLFATLHDLTNEEIDVVTINKISSVSKPDGKSLYAVILELLESHSNSFACGIRNEGSRSRRKRVIGGREATENSWPWIVNFVDLDNLQYCAGSIIDREWILTAVHCFVLADGVFPLKNYTYHLGDHRLNYTDLHERTIAASKLFIHPQYIGGDNDLPGNFDIALIQLARPLTFDENVRPVCLVEDGEIFMNETCYLSGWGNDKNTSDYHRSPVLKEARLDLVSRQECNSKTSYNGIIPDSFICAGFKEGGTDGCYGDSGGPLQCKRNGSWVQIGIMSWGKGCAEPNHYGVYSNVELLLPFVDAVRSGPNLNLTEYFLKTLEELIPMIAERSSKNLHDLLTNNGQFSDIDLVRNLQLFPHHFRVLNETNMMDVIFVSVEHNLTRNDTTVQYIAQTFISQADRLTLYMESRKLARQLNITFDDIVQLSQLTKEAFLDSKPSFLQQVRKTFEINMKYDKLKEYKENLMTYRENLNVSLNEMNIKKQLNMLSLNKIRGMKENDLKQIIVKENKMTFTKTLSIRNLSSFFGISRDVLKNMTVPSVLTRVLSITTKEYIMLHMFTAHQLEVIKYDKISSVLYPEDKSLYEITQAILREKENTNQCDENRCPNNAACIQETDHSFSCRCEKGYIGNGLKCNTGNQIYSSELVLNQTFTESLNDPNSAEYKRLAEEIQNTLTNAINKENSFAGFLGVQVTGFIKGSVIAQYVIVFQTFDTVSISKLTQVVDAALQNSSLQSSVNASRSLKATDLCSLGFHSCHMHATCSATNGILICKCKENYYGNGENCVDPCHQLRCAIHSYCFRGLNGDAKCVCDDGYAQQDGECEKIEDFKTALVIVACVTGALLLLALVVCWYQYCNRNRKDSLDIDTTRTVNKGRQNTGFDSMYMDTMEAMS